jgi:hypothetical protein
VNLNVCCGVKKCEGYMSLFQSVALPLELVKAAVKFRYLPTSEPRELREAVGETFRTVAAVCRHWFKTITAISKSDRRHLKRLFHCKILSINSNTGWSLGGVCQTCLNRCSYSEAKRCDGVHLHNPIVVETV